MAQDCYRRAFRVLRLHSYGLFPMLRERNFFLFRCMILCASSETSSFLKACEGNSMANRLHLVLSAPCNNNHPHSPIGNRYWSLLLTQTVVTSAEEEFCLPSWLVGKGWRTQGCSEGGCRRRGRVDGEQEGKKENTLKSAKDRLAKVGSFSS